MVSSGDEALDHLLEVNKRCLSNVGTGHVHNVVNREDLEALRVPVGAQVVVGAEDVMVAGGVQSVLLRKRT